MKKLIVLLLALAMVGAVSAQTAAPALKFSGAVYGGVQYDSGTDLVSFNRWYGGSLDAFRMRLNGSYSNDTIGMSFRLQSNDFTAPAFVRGLGWTKFFNGALTTKAGKLDDYSFATWYNSFGNFDGVTGAELIVAPIDGLKLGVVVPVYFGAARKSLSDTSKDLAFGLAYAAKGVGDLVATVNLDPVNKPGVTAGFNLKAVKNLTMYVEYNGVKVGDAAATHYVMQYAYYAMDKLTVGVIADQKFYASGAAAEYTVTPDVSYDVTDTLNLGVSFTLGLGGAAGWSVDPYGALAVKNGELAFGLGYDDTNAVKAYTFWTVNF